MTLSLENQYLEVILQKELRYECTYFKLITKLPKKSLSPKSTEKPEKSLSVKFQLTS